MKIKYIYDQKLMNGIFLALIPLIIPTNSILSATIVAVSMIVVHILFNISLTLLNEKIINKPYFNLAKLSLNAIIPFVFGLVFSLIFKSYSSIIINLSCYVAISDILLNTTINTSFKDFKENIKGCLPPIAILSIILLITAFIRELIGWGSLFGFSLLIGNLKPIALFNQTAGGLLLLGIIVALYSLLIKNNKEGE